MAATVIAHRARYRWPYRPSLERLDLTDILPAGPHSTLRIGFVTDTHVGPVFRAGDVDRAMALLFAEAPDVLLLGGDYVCESPRYIPEATAVLGDYAAAAPLGALAVLGNHDYSNDAPRLAAHLERRGIEVLRNEARPLSGVAHGLHIAGVDDAVLSVADPARAFSTIPPHAPTLALWHQPDWAEDAARFGPFLQVSGHSHGGQVRLPFVGPIAAPAGGKRFVAGLDQVDDMLIYTSRGVGVYRPPVRFRCSPEVTLITLS